MPTHNPLGQPVGSPLPDWTPRRTPARTTMRGRFCQIEPLDVERHAAPLFEAISLDTTGESWTYLASEPIRTLPDYRAYLQRVFTGPDPFCHSILDLDGKPLGIASLMRIDPANGVIEIGHIHYSRRLQRTPAASEAMFLFMSMVFDDLGYRRYEWKCDSLNAPSRAAAQRYGFRFEGIFRQAMVTKGRNRDTAWFSIIDSEWPALKAGWQAWLSGANFDADGTQRRRLADCIREATTVKRTATRPPQQR